LSNDADKKEGTYSLKDTIASPIAATNYDTVYTPASPLNLGARQIDFWFKCDRASTAFTDTTLRITDGSYTQSTSIGAYSANTWTRVRITLSASLNRAAITGITFRTTAADTTAFYKLIDIVYANGNSVEASGQIDGAQSFDGVDDYVDCGNPSSLNQLPEFTWESWFNLRAYNYFPHIVCKGSKESYVRDTLVITIRTSATTTWATSQSVEQITLATQTHYVATYNDNTDRKFHIFLQGKEVAYAIQDAAVGAITDDTTYPLRIADSYSLDRPLDGLISLVLIYNRALTPQEILDHYLVGKEIFG